MKFKCSVIAVFAIVLLASQIANADTPSAFGSGFDVQVFYKPFLLEEITPANMQKWPYYKHVSAHWDDYAVHKTARVKRSANPTKLAPGGGASGHEF